MAVADLLEKIGEGAKTVGRVAGAVAEPLAKRTAEVISGEAPEIDQDKRARAEKLEDEQLAIKASTLENNLAMGQKYGTLTPDQQQQYVDEITKIYSNPRHAPTLMEKLRKAIHPDGTFAQAPQKTLENPTPEGGTLHADTLAAMMRAKPNLKNFRNKDSGETVTWDVNKGELGPEWILTGTASGIPRSLGFGVGVQDAIKSMQTTNQQYLKPDGTPYTAAELAALPPTMQLRAFSSGGQVYYGIADQTQHTVTLGNVVYKMDQFGDIDTTQPQGVARVGSTSTQTAPGGGQVVTATTKPNVAGALGGAPPAAGAPLQGKPESGVAGALTGAKPISMAVPSSGTPMRPLNTSRNPEDQDPAISYAFNQRWAKPGPYSTVLQPQEEQEFRKWAASHPHDVGGMVGPGPEFAPLPNSGYDARGWFHAMSTGDPSGKRVKVATNFGTSMHGSDKFKTPYNGTFSNESQYATPNAPHWEGKGRLIANDGRLVVDETPIPPAGKGVGAILGRTGARPVNPNAIGASAAAAQPQSILPDIQRMTPKNAELAIKAQPAVTALLGLYGDPQNPSSPSMFSYVKLADDPHAQKVLGEAFKLLDQQMGEISDPGVLQALGTAAGWANFRAGVEAQAQQNAGTQMTPEERAYFDAAIASMADIIGSRAATGQSAARFSVRSIQNELPLIGLSGTPDSASYLTKMQTIGRQIRVGLNAMPDNGRAMAWLNQREAEIAKQKSSVAGALGKKIKVQHSASTGQDRWSDDGGVTWNPGKPPQSQ